MKQKRKYTRLSFEDAVELVGAYHSGLATQSDLAKKFGLARPRVCLLCNGKLRPDVYAAVEAAEKAEQGDGA